jgi:hypothetical protein
VFVILEHKKKAAKARVRLLCHRKKLFHINIWSLISHVYTHVKALNVVISFWVSIIQFIVEVKQSDYRAGHTLRIPGSWGFQISRKSVHEGGRVVSPTHRPPLPPPGNIPGTHFCQRLIYPQGHSAAGRIMSMKNSSDAIGNRTRELPVCSLNQLRHRVSLWSIVNEVCSRAFPYLTLASFRPFVPRLCPSSHIQNITYVYFR